jgi:hypothetical protein
MTEPSDFGSWDVASKTEIVEAIVRVDRDWLSGCALDEIPWRPDLVDAGKRRILHVHLADSLRPYAIDRLKAARDCGYEVNIALPRARLFDPRMVLDLAPLEPILHTFDLETPIHLAGPQALLVSTAMNQIQLPTPFRQQVGREAIRLAELPATAHLKGQRLENLVCFLMSQVRDLSVVEHDLRTATEELDVVVQNRALSGRSWMLPGSPLILVECKNWSTSVSQKEVSAFMLKAMGKRGTVRLGLMVGWNGYTSDAELQEIRFASGEITIALLTAAHIAEWVETRDPDEYLDTAVRRAMLR